MTMTRRLFSMFLPAAPAAAAQIGQNAMHIIKDTIRPVPNFPPPSPGLIGMVSDTYTDFPNLRKYHEAEREYNRQQSFKYERNSYLSKSYNLDPNIMALKSVSAQHKIVMHMMQEERERASRLSFIEKLKESLGLTEYFKKMSEGLAGSPEKSASIG